MIAKLSPIRDFCCFPVSKQLSLVAGVICVSVCNQQCWSIQHIITDIIIIYLHSTCYVNNIVMWERKVGIFGAGGNLLTLLAVPWAQVAFFLFILRQGGIFVDLCVGASVVDWLELIPRKTDCLVLIEMLAGIENKHTFAAWNLFDRLFIWGTQQCLSWTWHLRISSTVWQIFLCTVFWWGNIVSYFKKYLLWVM